MDETKNQPFKNKETEITSKKRIGSHHTFLRSYLEKQ